MIERDRERYGYPQTMAADTTYGNDELLRWLDERGIAPYIRVKSVSVNLDFSTDTGILASLRFSFAFFVAMIVMAFFANGTNRTPLSSCCKPRTEHSSRKENHFD